MNQWHALSALFASATAAEVTEASTEIRHQLNRILDSSAFRNSLRLSRFLAFVVEAALAGKSARIKAYAIATGALGRGTGFDPQTDPIVRVEAVRLRQALTRYYAGAGSCDPLVISLPRGTYVPSFRRRGGEDLLLRESMAHDPLAAAQSAVLSVARRELAAISDAIESARQMLDQAQALLHSAANAGFPAQTAKAVAEPSSQPHQQQPESDGAGEKAIIGEGIERIEVVLAEIPHQERDAGIGCRARDNAGHQRRRLPGDTGVQKLRRLVDSRAENDRRAEKK